MDNFKQKAESNSEGETINEEFFNEKFAKGVFAIVAGFVGVITISVLLSNEINPFFGIFIGLASSLLYPVIGAYSISFSEKILDWAFSERLKWHLSKRVLLGSVWPVTIFVSVVVSLYYGIVDRLYKD